MSFLFAVAVLAVVLGVLIFVHEAGHFLAAKAAGIHVHRFSLGLGSPIKALTFVRNGTEYSISWLPLGGYVKMATAEEDATSSALEGGPPTAPVPPDKMFEAKPVWKRMVVILAGVTMNVVFAWVAFTFALAKEGRQIDPVTTIGRVVAESLPPGVAAFAALKAGDRIVAVAGRPVSSWNEIGQGILSASGDSVDLELEDGRRLTLSIHHLAAEDRVRALQALAPYRLAVVGQLVPGSPAERAGLAVGDTILSLDGAPVTQWYDLVDRIRPNAGRPMQLAVGRKGVRLEMTLTPDSDSEKGPDGVARPVGRIGVYVATDFRKEKYQVGQAMAAGAVATLEASKEIIRLVRGMLSGRVSRRELGGPILIGQLAAQQARLGLNQLIQFMALLSVNLAVLNLLPIPVLDGGQFVFLLAEGVIRRPLSLKLRERLTMMGLLVILLLMVLAFSNDIARNWNSITGFFRGGS